MKKHKQGTSIEILMIEDNPDDVDLTLEALKDAKIDNNLNFVHNGMEALKFLRRQPPYEDAPRPDIILLDLNLPQMSGHEVLKTIKSDKDLKAIPVVILTTSQADEDIVKAYKHYANCYVTKPVDLNQFIHVVKAIDDFWVSIVRLPPE